MNNQSNNPLFGIYLFGNMILAILAVPYFAAAIISGYFEYMDLHWVLIFLAVDLLVLAGLSFRECK